jgi:hypothetical protein
MSSFQCTELLLNALTRILALTGEIDEIQIRSTVGDEVLALIRYRDIISADSLESLQVDIEGDRKEAVRQRLREADSTDNMQSCINMAEALGMSFEAGLGRRKLSKMYSCL